MRNILAVVLVGMLLMAAVGCNDAGKAGEDDATVKTMEEYKAEAAKVITEENAEAELKKLEDEIASDE